jgi:hypothetical protein
VAVACVGDMQYQRALARVTLPTHVQGVVVGRDEFGLGAQQLASGGEGVVGRLDGQRPAALHEAGDLLEVVHQRTAVDVRLGSELDLLSIGHTLLPSLGDAGLLRHRGREQGERSSPQVGEWRPRTTGAARA